MNETETAMRSWLETPGGRMLAAEMGGPSAALAALYAQDAAETDAARALQDHVETTRGWRPHFGEAKVLVRRPAAGQLSGTTADVVARMNRYDLRWRTEIDHEPRDARTSEAWAERRG